MLNTRVSRSSVGLSIGTLITIGPSPRTCISAGTGLRSHTAGAIAFAAIVHEREPLAFRIFKRQRVTTVALDDLAMLDATLVEPLQPPGECLPPHSQGGADDAARAAALARRRPVEEGEVGARTALRVRIKEVIRADIVLVDGSLHQPHSEGFGVEAAVVADFRGNRGQVVDAKQLHDFRL